MASTADSSSSDHQPSRATDVYAVTSSPTRRRDIQWSQIVRGDLELIAAVDQFPQPSPASPTEHSATAAPPPHSPASSVAVESSNDNAEVKRKKPVWKKPQPNGAVDTAPIMGGASQWPTLIDSAQKSHCKTLCNGSPSSSQGPVSSNQSQKQVITNANPDMAPRPRITSAPSHTEQSVNDGNGNSGGVSAGASFAYSSVPLPAPLPYNSAQMPHNGFGTMGPGMLDAPPLQPRYRHRNWDARPVGGFAPPAGNDPRNSSRRGNFGPRARGDGAYHNNNHGARRGQGRGNYGNGRNFHMQNQRAPPRGFVRPSLPNGPPIVGGPQFRPYANPMVYPDFMYYPPMPVEPFRGMQFISPPPASVMPMPVRVPTLSEIILGQIEFYFSDENLVTDFFLKSNMDDQGWVPITTIADFRRIKRRTSDIPFVLESLRGSDILEVQDNKVRRRNGWMKWIRNSSPLPLGSGSQSSNESNSTMLAAALQNIRVEEAATNQDSAIVKEDNSSGTVSEKCLSESTGPSLPNGECSEGTASSQY